MEGYDRMLLREDNLVPFMELEFSRLTVQQGI